MNKAKRYEILYRLHANNSHPATELIYHSPFELLIAVLLSAQSTDICVNKATNKLFLVANTPQTMLDLGINGIKSYIRSIGLFNRKAENIINICHILLKYYHGIVPANRSALESLPGVGRKTANVVLNTAFGIPTIAVDTHVFRVSNRTHFAIGKNVNAMEKRLLAVVPTVFKIHCHQWLMMHGRYICVARKPHCSSCLINDLCEYNQKHYLY